MVTLFRKLLIRIGKVIPFLFAFIVAFGYAENLYAMYMGNIVEYYNGEIMYDCPISIYISDIIFIDWFDVLLLYILAIALEFCKYNFRCVHYLLFNLLIRTLIEQFYMSEWVIVGISCFMALLGLYCVCGGIKILTNK